MLRRDTPTCMDCGNANARVYQLPGTDVLRMVCATCEYRREFPDGPMIPGLPRTRRVRLQKERLFDVNDYTPKDTQRDN